MPVVAVTYYTATATYNGVTWDGGTQKGNPLFPCPEIYTLNGVTVGRIPFGATYLYPYFSWLSFGSGPRTVANGTPLCILEQSADLKQVRAVSQRTTVSGSSYVNNEGSRLVKVECTSGGSVTSPSVGPSTTVTAVTRPDGNTSAVTDILQVVAGAGAAATGSLTSRGLQAGTFVNWTWPSAVFSSASQVSPGVATATTIMLSLLAGTEDGTIRANFSQPANPADTWKPGKGNGTVIVHILDDNLAETTNSNTTSLAWGSFKTPYLTAISATSGSVTAEWFGTSPVSAYLLNVNSATFTATPKSPYSVYKWRLERPGGTDEEVYGQNSASFSTFAAGNVVHLYLTTASAAPRIRYDGFDGEQPTDTTVIDPTAAAYPVGKSWASPTAGSFTLQLSPSAWIGPTLGLSKYVVLDGGSPTQIPASAKSWTFTSGTAPYSVLGVEFKQVQAAATGELTVNVVKDTNTADVSVAVSTSQRGIQLGVPLTATGTVDYYPGEGSLSVSVVPTYSNGAVPSSYSITLSLANATESDTVGGLSATVDATASTRVLTVTVTRIVQLAALSGVAINVTRDTTDGTEVVSSTGSTLQAAQGSMVVTFTPGASSLPVHVSCDAGVGYSLRRIIVNDGGGTPYVFATVGAKTEIDITLTVPYSKDGSNIRVILVVVANLVPTPVVNPANAYDQGKFLASVTGDYGDFRTGDTVTVDVTPVMFGPAYMTGLAVGRIAFNGVDVAATRDGDTLTVEVPLVTSANVFTVAMYAVLETAYSGSPSPTPTIAVAWREDDTITLSATTYHRLGNAFTISAEKVRGSTTGISVTSALRSVAASFPYVTDSVLPFDTPNSAATGEALFTLKGAQKATINYAAGVQYPELALAVYNYQTTEYVTQGVRPVLVVTPASGVTLSENLASTWTPPVTNPGTDYTDAVFVVREVTSTALFPSVTVSVSSGGGRLEVWDGTNWLPRETRNLILASETTFARWAVGTPPSGLVNLTISAPEYAVGGSMPAAVRVYVASPLDNIDKTVYAPSVVPVSKNSAVGISVVTPPGFVFIEWSINGSVVKGISASLVMSSDTTVVPKFAIATTVGAAPMILSGSETEYDEGIWVSKLFRAQWPWKPLVAVVVKEAYETSAQLAVGLGTDLEIPDGMFADNAFSSRISVVDGKMRRLPPSAVQKSRFVRYALKLLGSDTVYSVSVATGATTLKGGH